MWSFVNIRLASCKRKGWKWERKERKTIFQSQDSLQENAWLKKRLIQTAAHYSLETCLQKQQNCDVTIHGQEFKELDE